MRADLASHPSRCTLAYFHHARFSSSENVRNFWNVLYAAGVELVLNGHDHDYERLAPLTPAGNLDTARGIRQIIIGTGGKNHGAENGYAPHRQAANDNTFGVLRLRLRPGSYAWNFVPEPGGTFTDSGTSGCH